MDGITLTRLIAELGVMTVFCGVGMWLISKYFNKKINNESTATTKLYDMMQDTIKQQKEANRQQTDAILDTQKEIKETLSNLAEAFKTQNSTLQGIKEALEPATINMLNNIANAYFDLAKENVIRMICEIKDENNLDNKEATSRKIRERVKILHDARNDAFSYFQFRGRVFSEFTSDEWISRISKLVENEVYGTVSNKRTWANVDNAYKAIKLEFLKNATG